MLAKTRKKMDVVFTGPAASGAARYSQAFYLNDVQFESGQPQLTGPGLTPWTLNFKPMLCLSHQLGSTPATRMRSRSS